MESKDAGFNLPEWYRIEQESKKAIERLHNIKDLAFYSENPDPFIRRLAILRAGAIGSREAFAMLNNVTEDPLESEQNRMLAGAFMQKINETLNLGFFIQNRYMQVQQAGPADSGKSPLAVTDSQPAIRYDFSKSLIESQLQLDQSFIKLNLDDKEFAFKFQFSSWLKNLGSALGANFALYLKKFVKLVLAILAGIVKALFVNLPKDIARNIKAGRAAKKERAEIKEQATRAREQSANIEKDAEPVKEQSAYVNENAKPVKGQSTYVNEHAERVSEQLIGIEEGNSYEPGKRSNTVQAKAPVSVIEWPELTPPAVDKSRYQRVSPMRYKRSRSYGMPFTARCGMVVRRFFYILFSPLRFALRHKVPVFGSLLAIYLLVSLTTPGKDFLNKISPSLCEANGRFVQNIASYTVKAFQGTLFADNEMPASAPDIAGETAPAPQKPVQYVVTAPKGLYLRSEPAENGGKIKLMKVSTTVDFMDEKTETGDVTWFKIRLEDGTSGWANSSWLSEVNDG